MAAVGLHRDLPDVHAAVAYFLVACLFDSSVAVPHQKSWAGLEHRYFSKHAWNFSPMLRSTFRIMPNSHARVYIHH